MLDSKTRKVSATLAALWWMLGASVIVFCLLATLVSMGLTVSFDQAVLLWLNQHASPTLDTFFLSVTHLGGVVFVTLASFLLLAITIWRKRYYKSLLVVIGMGGAIVLNLILKSIFERPRPDLWEWLITETSYSFPSGHATVSMALALCVVVLVWWTKWRILAVVIAGLYVVTVGISRMYLGVHYPTDIMGGWLLGVAWISFVSLCIYWYQRYHVRERSIEP